MSAAEAGPYLLSVSSTFSSQGPYLTFDVPSDHTVTGAVFWSVSALNSCLWVAYHPATGGYFAPAYATFRETYTNCDFGYEFLPQSSSFNVWTTNDGFSNAPFPVYAFLSTNQSFSTAPWSAYNTVFSPALVSAVCTQFPSAGFCSWLTDPNFFQYSATSVIPGGTWYLAGLNSSNPPAGYGEVTTIEFGDIQLVAKPTTVSPTPPMPPSPSATCANVDGYKVAVIALIVLALALGASAIYLALQKDSAIKTLLEKIQ